MGSIEQGLRRIGPRRVGQQVGGKKDPENREACNKGVANGKLFIFRTHSADHVVGKRGEALHLQRHDVFVVVAGCYKVEICCGLFGTRLATDYCTVVDGSTGLWAQYAEFANRVYNKLSEGTFLHVLYCCAY